MSPSSFGCENWGVKILVWGLHPERSSGRFGIESVGGIYVCKMVVCPGHDSRVDVGEDVDGLECERASRYMYASLGCKGS